MSETVLISVVGVLGTLLGAAVTSLVSVYSNLKTKQLEAKNSFVITRLQSKEATYNEFIAELHYRSLTTFHGKKTEKDRLPRLMDLASKIQMYSEELGQCADELVEIIYSMEQFGTYGSKYMESGVSFADKRNEFILLCRNDIESSYTQLTTT
ncbi:hypothetical protein ACPFUU_003417 [Vibrio cholerae]|uniref:hypothetical protein n=1 Tax=Vibrio cholerae TaxID=666 RepID=UPI001A21A965|nr:hypothetical protein [Vibrio cholerae]EJX7570143.1 hypothetical protein [Vibrio cholerae]EKF9742456.1 hypothetical protein [Vibrio cholerae]ELD3372176.1 hypothetical protein [Vibrio cholerae]MCS0097694.1 hypothetical protein [Vibrio cholerae]MDV2304582.1 hypothetical protein [Vibrio cholerae]